MTAEYDQLVRPYQRSKELPFRGYSEIPDHLELIGDVRGRSVLDLACGEGFYTRLIKKAGADRVMGVDCSGRMIAMAREQEADEPLGITYMAMPAEGLEPMEPFDVVSAAFLLNCASTTTSLASMARAIAGNLLAGGRLVTTISMIWQWPGVDYSPYGMTTDVTRPLDDGEPYHVTFLIDDDRFTIEDFAYSRATYEAALAEAGLANFRWHPPRVTEAGLTAFGPDFWRVYLTHPPILRLSAERPAS
jgi:SAM-dependent methyltransferase